MKVDPQEIAYDRASLVDGHGRVFWWQGEVYRGIVPQAKEFVEGIFANGKAEKLFEAGLVRTEIAPLEVPGYELVLKHEKVPVISFAAEWCFEMFKDAALFICDLMARLSDEGLTLSDPHPWNVQFVRGRPVYIDVGSLAPIDRYNPYPTFLKTFVYPLYLIAAGEHLLLRPFTFRSTQRLTGGEVLKLTLNKIKPSASLRLIRMNLKARSVQKGRRFWESIRETVNAIPPPRVKTQWTSYDGKYDQPLEASENWTQKHRTVDQVLRSQGARTVLDIAANKGWYSRLAEKHGARVVSIDIDEVSIGQLYEGVKRDRNEILPLVMDICFPTPRHGVFGSYPPAAERLNSELVMALAVTHHLVRQLGIELEAIAEQLAAFSSRAVLVEFIPADDSYIRDWNLDRHSWYNLDDFVRVLRKRFTSVEVLPSYPDPRKLVLCKK